MEDGREWYLDPSTAYRKKRGTAVPPSAGRRDDSWGRVHSLQFGVYSFKERAEKRIKTTRRRRVRREAQRKSKKKSGEFGALDRKSPPLHTKGGAPSGSNVLRCDEGNPRAWHAGKSLQ